MDEVVLTLWPRNLSRQQAASYVGVSVQVFDAEVRSGHWPRPETRGLKNGKLTWDRRLLDAAQDRHSGLDRPAVPDAAVAAPQPDPERAAWEDRLRGQTPQQRPQHRPQAPRRRVG